MALLELMLIFVLQFEAGISGRDVYLYYRPGHEATLPCDRPLSDDSCDHINWLYYKDPSMTIYKVRKGIFEKSSAGDARLSLSTGCSLVINNITAEDVGLYLCRYAERPHEDVNSYVTILTVSSSQPKQDGEVTLTCSLLRYPVLPQCRLNSIRWVDGTGKVLLGETDSYRFDGQRNCASYLTLKHQSGHNKPYTCQIVQDGVVKIDAPYTPVLSGGTGPTSDHHQTIIIVGAVVGGLVVLLIIAAVFIRYRRGARETNDAEKPTLRPDEADTTVTYATVNHANPKPSPEITRMSHTTYKPCDFPIPNPLLSSYFVRDEITAAPTETDEADNNVTYATVNHANKKTSPQRKVKQEVEEMVTYSTVKAQT